MRQLSLLLLAFVLQARADSWREQRLEADLQQDPRNVAKILALAALKLDDATALNREAERADALDQVQILYLRAQAIEPRNAEVFYHLGVVSWMKVFPAVVAARSQAAMDPETPGPVRDRSARAVLNGKYRPDIDYAIASLEQSIALDPSSSEAMAYLQMAYRARADFKDTRSEWDADQNAAGAWRARAYDVGMANLEETRAARNAPPPIASWAVVFFPSAIALDENAMQQKLLRVERVRCLAIANPLSVTLNAVIDRDGSVLYLEPLDGPAEAQPTAIEIARSRIYRPTLFNGKEVMVKTRIIIDFDSCRQP